MSRGAAQEVRRPQDQREGCSRRGTLPQDAVRRLSRPKHFSRQGDRHWQLDHRRLCKRHEPWHRTRPAFPYFSYQRMTYEDLIDLKAYLDTLPAVKNEVPPHELSFPFNIRRGLGLWQILYVDGKSFTPDAKANAELNRGAYLVMGPGTARSVIPHATSSAALSRERHSLAPRTPKGGAPSPISGRATTAS